MNRQYELIDPIKTKLLPNNVHFAVYDLSKPIAGDRWFVRICCVAKVFIPQDLFDTFDEDLELLKEMRESCNDTLTLEIVKERNFIDDKVKDDVAKELIQQIEQNSLHYMGSESFPRKFFLIRFEEFKIKYRINQNKVMNEIPEINDEDDGPADFSACFRD